MYWCNTVVSSTLKKCDPRVTYVRREIGECRSQRERPRNVWDWATCRYASKLLALVSPEWLGHFEPGKKWRARGLPGVLSVKSGKKPKKAFKDGLLESKPFKTGPSRYLSGWILHAAGSGAVTEEEAEKLNFRGPEN